MLLCWCSLWSPNSLTSSQLSRKLCLTESACYRKSENTTPPSPYDVQRERNQTSVQMRRKICLVDKPEEQDVCLFWLKVLIHLPFNLSVRSDGFSSVSASVLHRVFLYSDFSLFVTALHSLTKFPVGGGLKSTVKRITRNLSLLQILFTAQWIISSRLVSMLLAH